MTSLTEHIDFYFDDNGYMVFTEKYLKKKKVTAVVMAAGIARLITEMCRSHGEPLYYYNGGKF